MRKTIIVTITILLSSLLFVSCTSGPNASIERGNTIHFKEMPLKKVHSRIMKAGEDAGWRMTEFKENEVIAEKSIDDNTQAVTIKFSKSFFYITPENSDLEDAIKTKLQ